MFNQDSSEKRGLCSTFRPREMLQNLLCLWIKKMQVVLFCFSFRATLSSTLMNALVYVDIHQGIYKGKTQSCLKWKMKKTKWVFFFYKYSKFWSVLPDKKLISNLFFLKSELVFRENWLYLRHASLLTYWSPLHIKLRWSYQTQQMKTK